MKDDMAQCMSRIKVFLSWLLTDKKRIVVRAVDNTHVYGVCWKDRPAWHETEGKGEI